MVATNDNENFWKKEKQNIIRDLVKVSVGYLPLQMENLLFFIFHGLFKKKKKEKT